MATNEYLDEGENLALPVAAGTISGGSVLVGTIVGVALTDRASTTLWGGGNVVGSATVATTGVYFLNVVGAIANVGDPVYIVAADNTLTATAGTNKLFGVSLDTQGATGIVRVKIHQV